MTLNIQIRLEDLIPKFDAFYVTRKQNERIAEKNTVVDADYPKIDSEFLKDKRFKETVVMHPLPRRDEISPELEVRDHDCRDEAPSGRLGHPLSGLSSYSGPRARR